MKVFLPAAVLLGGLVAVPQAHALCTYPLAPGKFPDGTVASRAEIDAAKALVIQYDADMNAYLVCIRSEYEAKLALLADATSEQKAELERVHEQKEDAANAEVKDVQDRINAQVEAWNARNAAKKKSS
ncbi:MAG TPA: hypothetical protein VF033_10085 [Steroidobacteraceae bacterium]|jgi:hypothetical protein